MSMECALFITCLTDTLAPQVGQATVELLEHQGVAVRFPSEQTCCGQMHFNSGYVDEARRLARRFVYVFGSYEAVVAPSGSCVAHVRAHLAGLAGDGDGLSERTWELTEFLVDRCGVEDVGSRFRGRVTYHPTCHSLRGLRLGDRPISLLRASGVDVVELPDADECCGFGGTFAVKNADVSAAMLDAKLDHVLATGAEVVCACDSSCLLHIGGGLRRRGAAVRALHLAEVLAP
jgi:L-lactate dehydrogenase complex protein LldE